MFDWLEITPFSFHVKPPFFYYYIASFCLHESRWKLNKVQIPSSSPHLGHWITINDNFLLFQSTRRFHPRLAWTGLLNFSNFLTDALAVLISSFLCLCNVPKNIFNFFFLVFLQKNGILQVCPYSWNYIWKNLFIYLFILVGARKTTRNNLKTQMREPLVLAKKELSIGENEIYT